MSASRSFAYPNPQLKNKKHKSAAKDRRRITRNAKMNVNKTPHELGEEVPPFMIPARYKLIFKYL